MIAAIAGSNPAGGVDTHILYFLFVADDHLRGVLQSVCI